MATGATAAACLRLPRVAGVVRLVLAVPVAPPDTVARLTEPADEVVTLATPQPFGAVGRLHRSFRQLSDDDAVGYLSDTE